MTEERELFIRALKEADLAKKERVKAWEIIENSDIKAHGKTVPFSYIPLTINEEDCECFDGIIRRITKILEAITLRYVEDPQYRKIFGFSKEMEELITLPCFYREVIPVGRYDFFYDEKTGDYQVCEFNTDGSGGMSRDKEISRVIIDTFPEGPFQKNYEMSAIPLIENIAKKLVEIYQSDANAVEEPNFCITDFREEGVFSDFERFIEAFEALGINARFTDVRDLKFDGEKLIDQTDGTVIHGIYRRAVTSVVLERLDECRDLIEAVKAGKVVLMGHFRTSLAHSKMIHAAMYHKDTLAMLEESDRQWIREHIPATYRLDKELPGELFAQIKQDKDHWVIKPAEGFGSQGVSCGMDLTEEEWEDRLCECVDRGFMIQKFCKRTAVQTLLPGDDRIRMMPLMLGICQAGGRAVGCYSRAGMSGTIDYDHNGICVSTILIRKRQG